jgi:hypothetical protein
MNRLTHYVLACLILPAVVDTARAVPDLRNSRMAGSLTVFSDDQRAEVFYYPPGELALSRTSDGKPDLHFLQMRYTGNVSTADRGTSIFRSLLSFRIVMSGPTAAQVQTAKTALIASGAGRNLELRPLPICRMEASLVYAPINPSFAAATAVTPSEASSSEGSVQTLPPGHFEEVDGAGRQVGNAYWTERIYTLSLEPEASQVFWETLQRGQVALSIAYVFYSSGVGPENPIEELSGSPELVNELRRQIATRRANDSPASSGDRRKTPEYLVRAGATSVTVEAQRWTELFRRIDVNQQNAPPGYALVDVYCYDFNNALRPDLYEKQVELVAQGVAGRRVTLFVAFNRNQPDLYSRSLRFPVAVRMDRPLRYRVHEVNGDGTEKISAWQERASWIELIDVTTQSPNDNPAATNPGD